MGIWSDAWRTEARDWAFGRLGGWETGEIIPPSASYLSIMLRQLRLVNIRVGFNRFYGTVHSYARLPHLSGQAIEFLGVTTPSQLRDVPRRNLDRFVMGGHRLVGPVPYMGGDLELEIGLFSVKSQDMLKPYLELLEELTNAAGTSVFSVAKPYIAPLKRGVDLISGGDTQASLEIGVAVTFDAPREGTYYVARFDSSSHDFSRFSVDDNYRLLDGTGSHVRDAPYIVFSVEQRPVRDDWFTIPEIADAYVRLNDIVKEQAPFKVVSSYEEHLRRVVMASPDVLPAHGRTISDWVAGQVARAMGSVNTGGGAAGTALPELRQLDLSRAVV